jgi:hypothetical protein
MIGLWVMTNREAMPPRFPIEPAWLAVNHHVRIGNYFHSPAGAFRILRAVADQALGLTHSAKLQDDSVCLSA